MEEEVIRNHNYSKDIKIYQKSFDELIKDSKFATSFNKLPKRKTILKSSTQARTVMEEQYGFTITNTPVRVMQVGNLTSYTFHIERNTPNSTYFENLVVQNDSIGNTTAHIIKYTPFMPMTSYIEHNSYSFNGNTEFTSIIYDDNNINGKMVTECRDLYGFRCTGSYSTSNGSSCTASPHIPMGYCTDLTPECIKYTFITESCTSYDDGITDISTGGGTSSGSSQSGGSGTGGTDPIYSDPLCPTCPEFSDDNPCIRLVNKTNNAAFKQKFKDLNVPANYTSTQESGFGEVIVNGESQFIDGIPNGQNELIIPPGSINLTHIHNNKPKSDAVGTIYDGRVKIHSPGDIIILSKSCQISNTSSPENAFVIMISDEGIFAISIIESFDFNTTVDINKWIDFIKYYNKESDYIVTDPNNNGTNRKIKLQKMLLKGLNKLGLNNKIAFFEGQIENQNDPDINNYKINWTQKKFDKGNTITEIPCNN